MFLKTVMSLRILPIVKCLFLVLQVSSSLCQYMMDVGMRADMTFDEDNERFDVGNIIAEQNRVYKEQPTQNDFDYRRIGRDQVPLVEFLKQNRRKLQKKESGRRLNIADFAYHDQMLSEPDDDEETYNRNLLNFKAQNARRRLQIIDLANLRTGGNNTINNKKSIPDNKERSPDIYANGKNVYTTKNIHEVVLRYLHGGKDEKQGKNGRRQGVDADNEVLLHYAVPINMKINGYLEVPLVQQ